MFSLHMQERRQAPARKPRHADRLRGMVLGFVAGMTVVLALDMLVLNHALLHGLSHLDGYMPQLVRSAIAQSFR